MSLSAKNLSLIQKAGQATHSASEAIAASLQAQAQSMVISVATQPFSSESEQALARFKMLASLNQGLASVETQLKELFGIASELAGPASDVVIALPYAAKHESSNASAVDVTAKPARAVKGAKKRSKGKKGAKTSVASGPHTANDTALLQYLQKKLNADTETRMTGGEMANGSGLPLGSVGVSLKKILASGIVTSNARGVYLLGPTTAVSIATSGTKTRSVKQSKPVLVRKVKAAIRAQEPAPVDETVAAK